MPDYIFFALFHTKDRFHFSLFVKNSILLIHTIRIHSTNILIVLLKKFNIFLRHRVSSREKSVELHYGIFGSKSDSFCFQMIPLGIPKLPEWVFFACYKNEGALSYS